MVTTRQVSEPAREATWPALLDEFRRDGFALTPNYQRPLDGRVVGQRFDPATGKMRDVTDYEVVGGTILRCGLPWQREAFGRLVRQVWGFSVDGVRLQINDAFQNWPHYGLQYCTACPTCGADRWINADRAPGARCKDCRDADHTTPRCSVFDVRCSTAYKGHRCRCQDCRSWNAAKHRRLKRLRKATGNPSVSSPGTQEGKLSSSSSSFCSCSTNAGVTSTAGSEILAVETDTPSEGWRWIPDRVRATLSRYEVALNSALAHATGGQP